MKNLHFCSLSLFFGLLVSCAEDFELPVPSNSTGVAALNAEKSSVLSNQRFELKSHNLILPGHTRMSLRQRHFFFKFSNPISSIPKNAIMFNGVALDTRLSPDQKHLLASLSEPFNELFPNDKTVVVSFSNELKDENGSTLLVDNLEFEIADHPPDSNRIVKSVDVIGYDRFALIDWSVDHLAFAQLKFGLNGFELNCAQMDCPTLDFTQFPFEFPPIQDLEENASYLYQISIIDIFGREEVISGQFKTRPLANVALNEIFAYPQKAPGKTDSHSEFIEILNSAEEPVDLTDFSIRIGNKHCSLESNGSPIVIPGKSLLLIVGKKFEPAIFGLSESPLIFRMRGQTICGNLSNSDLRDVRLIDKWGRTIDAFFGIKGPNPRGQSIERLNPFEKNGRQRYCYSRAESGPTPLRVNSVTTLGC